MAEIRIQKKKSKFVPIMLIIIIITLIIWLIYSIYYKKAPSQNSLNSYSVQVIKLTA